MLDYTSFYQKHLQGRHNQEDHGRRYRVPGKAMDVQGLLNSHTLESVLNGSVSIHGEEVLASLYKEQGYDGKPRLVNEKSLQSFIRKGEPELFRVVFSDTKSAETYAEDFRKGEYFAGSGIFGNGTYTYDKALKSTALERAEQRKGALLHMTLAKGSKTISLDKLREEREVFRRKIQDESNKLYNETDLPIEVFRKKKDQLWKADDIIRDLGNYATLAGYDAVHVPEKDYTIVLNRTALRVAEKE